MKDKYRRKREGEKEQLWRGRDEEVQEENKKTEKEGGEGYEVVERRGRKGRGSKERT